MVTTISPSVFLSKCESRLRDERASKDPEDTSFAHAVSGNSLHHFVLENLLSTTKQQVSVELPGAAWANDTVSGSEGLPRLRSGFRLRIPPQYAKTARPGGPGKRPQDGSTSTRTSLSQAQGRARSGRQRDNVFSQTETLLSPDWLFWRRSFRARGRHNPRRDPLRRRCVVEAE